jgi:hypothetical protein
MNRFSHHSRWDPAMLHTSLNFVLIILTSVLTVGAATGRILNVKDYGATGRKEDDARPAIQKAIETAAAAGGGTVLFPPGLYTSGTLHLRSHIRIELAEGATLFASTDPKAYDFGTIPSKAALFYGDDLEDVSFGGKGIVDGQAQYDWRPDDFEQGFEHKTRMQSLGKSLMRSVPKGFPKREVYPHMVWLGRCKNVRVNGLNFLHSPSWTFALYACRNASFDGLYIYTSLKEAVWADGIDLDGCKEVSIANCVIETGDDCVALVSMNTWGPAVPCEDIRVTNCHFSSASAGVKFSEGNRAGVRKIQVTHCLFNNVNRGFVFITAFGGSISDVTLSDLTINCSRFDWFWAGDAQPFKCSNHRLSDIDPVAPKSGDVPPGAIRQLTFRNIVAHAKGSSLFYGNTDRWLESINMENLKLFISTDPTAPYDEAEHALDFRRVENLKLKDVEVVWEEPFLSTWKSALNFEDVRGLDIDGFLARPAGPQRSSPIIAMSQISGARIRHARAVAGTDVFSEVTGNASHDIRFESCDLSQARVACQVDKDVAPDVVQGLPTPRTGATARP